MRLVMFDIDGTLTETMKVDEERFVRSFAEVFGLTDIDADWSHYPHVTDSGIFHEVYAPRSEEHTSELQSRGHLVCRLLLEKKKKRYNNLLRVQTQTHKLVTQMIPL